MQRCCPLGSFRFCCCQNSVLQFYRNAGILILPEWFDVRCCECAVCCGRDVSRAPVFFVFKTCVGHQAEEYCSWRCCRAEGLCDPSETGVSLFFVKAGRSLLPSASIIPLASHFQMKCVKRMEEWTGGRRIAEAMDLRGKRKNRDFSRFSKVCDRRDLNPHGICYKTAILL